MLPKFKRLNLKKSFKWVVSGRRLDTPSFKIWAKTSYNSFPLIGISLSSSIFKKPSKRNLARRKTSFAIEKTYPLLRNNLNLVIMPKQGVLIKDKENLIKELINVKEIFRETII